MDLTSILLEMSSLITEGASPNDINDAINKKYRLVITYYDDDDPKGKLMRVIEPYAYGLSKAGNPVVRAFQFQGDTRTIQPQWKFFRLDRITSINKTEHYFYRPISDYKSDIGKFNPAGDMTMSTVFNIAKFDNQSQDGKFKEPRVMGKIDLSRDTMNKGVYKQGSQEPKVEPQPNQPKVLGKMQQADFDKATKGWKSPFDTKTKEVDKKPNDTEEIPTQEPAEIPNIQPEIPPQPETPLQQVQQQIQQNKPKVVGQIPPEELERRMRNRKGDPKLNQMPPNVPDVDELLK